MGRAGDGCRIAHRPPSLSEPDESLRVVLGDALLGHWLAACLGDPKCNELMANMEDLLLRPGVAAAGPLETGPAGCRTP